MKTIVIYHSADYDGIFCREIAKKFLPDAELIGWNFGDPPIPWERLRDSRVYVLDLPCDAPVGAKFPEDVTKTLNQRNAYYGTQGLVWIDHHKTSIDSHPKEIRGYRIDGVAACRLAWQWFSIVSRGPEPTKPDYIDRKVIEPNAVRLAGEYDIWDKRDPEAETFQYGLRSVEEGADFWEALLALGPLGYKASDHIIELGRPAQRYAIKTDASICKARSWIMEWEGLKFLCLNSARFNSLTFAARDVPETGHDALMGFCWNGTIWTVSLYHARHRTDLDLSSICKKYGGGGHKGACGFTAKTLPFVL